MYFCLQDGKKVVSNSPGLVDFAIGLVNSVINLPNGQVKFFEEFKLQKNCEINLLIKPFLGLVEMMFGLVNVSFSLPEWQAVRLTFFAPCLYPASRGPSIFFNTSLGRSKGLCLQPRVVVVQFHFCFKFYLPWFFGIVMCENEC